MTLFEERIVGVVQQIQKEYRRGVLPRMVQARLDFSRCEQQVRKDLKRLAERGVLVRIGGEGARRGYCVA